MGSLSPSKSFNHDFVLKAMVTWGIPHCRKPPNISKHARVSTHLVSFSQPTFANGHVLGALPICKYCCMLELYLSWIAMGSPWIVLFSSIFSVDFTAVLKLSPSLGAERQEGRVQVTCCHRAWELLDPWQFSDHQHMKETHVWSGDGKKDSGFIDVRWCLLYVVQVMKCTSLQTM